jgi:hypothetical protein
MRVLKEALEIDEAVRAWGSSGSAVIDNYLEREEGGGGASN